MPNDTPENDEWDDPVYVAGLERLNVKQERMIDRLCSELAASESCPFETKDGCVRPDELGVDRFDSGMCVKHDRRSRFGAECWRLWATKGNDNE